MDSLESLRAELSEVMVHVLVHQLRPLLRSQPPKKAVGMRRATLRAGRDQLVNQFIETFALRFER